MSQMSFNMGRAWSFQAKLSSVIISIIRVQGRLVYINWESFELWIIFKLFMNQTSPNMGKPWAPHAKLSLMILYINQVQTTLVYLNEN